MGLGKTVQALSVAWYYCRDWPLLIICPSSLRLTWAAGMSFSPFSTTVALLRSALNQPCRVLELRKWLGITADEIKVVYKGSDKIKAQITIVRYGSGGGGGVGVGLTLR
jgi:SWI/SNF-related matrix-associated actin-dependent regulator 1 of chromatin subfamily A